MRWWCIQRTRHAYAQKRTKRQKSFNTISDSVGSRTHTRTRAPTHANGYAYAHIRTHTNISGEGVGRRALRHICALARARSHAWRCARMRVMRDTSTSARASFAFRTAQNLCCLALIAPSSKRSSSSISSCSSSSITVSDWGRALMRLAHTHSHSWRQPGCTRLHCRASGLR